MIDRHSEIERPLSPTRGWGVFVWRGARYVVATAALLALTSALSAVAYRFVGPPLTVLQVQRASQGYDVRRDWVRVEEVSPYLINALLAAEDSRFCSHAGFDVKAVREAISQARNGERLRGASTLSQQTAKNVFLWNGGGFVRKGLEAYFTVLIETLWPKKRIVEVYLNVAEWGDGLFGVEAASRARFGKTAADLTPHEAALLAAVLPSPQKWRLDPPGPYVSSRAATLELRAQVVAGDRLAACILE